MNRSARPAFAAAFRDALHHSGWRALSLETLTAPYENPIEITEQLAEEIDHAVQSGIEAALAALEVKPKRREYGESLKRIEEFFRSRKIRELQEEAETYEDACRYANNLRGQAKRLHRGEIRVRQHGNCIYLERIFPNNPTETHHEPNG